MTGFAKCVGLAPRWIIEVSRVPGRSPRWFGGEIQPGRHGVAVLSKSMAEQFVHKSDAQFIAAYIWPRPDGMGEWKVRRV